MKEQDLRDKFINANTLSNCLTLAEVTDQCVQIAKDYAESQKEKEAIEFSQWMHENTVKDAKFYTVILDVVRYNQTLTECYQLFKNREN